MKKIILSLTIVLSSVAFVAAQEGEGSRADGTTTKKGYAILPAAGDFAIGIEANPFLKYVGNMFSDGGANLAPTFNGVNQTIDGKYFLSESSAVRVKLGFNFGTDQSSAAVTNDEITSNNPLNANATTVDYKFNKQRELKLNLGYEMRRGYGRLQGFYGAELGLGYRGNLTKYEYGNPMTELNQTPSTIDFNTGLENNPNARPTEDIHSKIFSAGLNGFIGVEYFIARKISIGGELGLGLYADMSNFGKTTNQLFNTSTNAVETSVNRIGAKGYNNIHFRTVPNGSLFLLFHF